MQVLVTETDSRKEHFPLGAVSGNGSIVSGRS
jgi:hypothetical protein